VELLEIILLILLSVVIVLALVILHYIKHPKYRKRRRSLLVKPAIARYSREVLRELCCNREVLQETCYIFEKRYGRLPNKNELLIRLIIKTSHIVDNRPTWRGHWHRWRIRMLLASENGVWYGKRVANNINIKIVGKNQLESNPKSVSK
jgi:hypothetical protein